MAYRNDNKRNSGGMMLNQQSSLDQQHSMMGAYGPGSAAGDPNQSYMRTGSIKAMQPRPHMAQWEGV